MAIRNFLSQLFDQNIDFTGLEILFSACPPLEVFYSNSRRNNERAHRNSADISAAPAHGGEQ